MGQNSQQNGEENFGESCADPEPVCFGMLMDINVIPTSNSSIQEQCPLSWSQGKFLHHKSHERPPCELPPKIAKVLNQLVDSGDVDVQFILQRANTPEPIPFTTNVCAILYGPTDIGEAIGDWLSKCQLYLQLPYGCSHNVPYANPHRLNSGKARVMTFDIDTDSKANGSMDFSYDLFADLQNEDIWEESPQPATILTPLHEHQKRALSFMLSRERGWDLTGERQDLWKAFVDLHGTQKYRNTLTGSTQFRPPAPFRGGILADEMGLGKTCTMLALVASSVMEGIALIPGSLPGIKATLIVVPFSLLQVWEKQILDHFEALSINFQTYYGASRHLFSREREKCDIFITSYNTVALEWKSFKSARRGNSHHHLFSNHWHRIVLDEAHMIRNQSTTNAKAVSALHATHRWCITGTPIQNRLGDVASLLRFLRVSPYDEPKTFEREIAQPLRTGEDQAAIRRLQKLMKIISVRRPRKAISLPDREEVVESVEFTAEEAAIYDHARKDAIDLIDSALSSNGTGGSAYINAFQRINKLRYICNHGKAPRYVPKLANQGVGWNETIFQQELDKLLEPTVLVCRNCATDIQEDDEESSNRLGRTLSAVQQSSSLCQNCAAHSVEPLQNDFDKENTFGGSSSTHNSSSKIMALMSEIKRIPKGDKCAVFSYWTSTLDAIEVALMRSGIGHTRYDGRMTKSKRASVLSTFDQDPAVTTLLVSISCGGQGLDLTAANHAFLIEPQWNPMLEEQAMSRVHRMGQTKPVRLVRFVMRHTWEEKIVAVQKLKRTLADLVVNGARLKEGDAGKKQMLHLRELID